MVVWKNKDLSLAGKPPKGRCVQDAVTVPFETRAVWVCVFRDSPVTGAYGVGS